jgi:hypothetical protein
MPNQLWVESGWYEGQSEVNNRLIFWPLCTAEMNLTEVMKVHRRTDRIVRLEHSTISCAEANLKIRYSGQLDKGSRC